MESEVDFTIPSKEPKSVTSSPTSVASTYLEFAPVPEMKPLPEPLPGAWITVGKGGRAVSMIGTSMLDPNAAAFVPAFYPIEDNSNEAKHVDDILRIMHHLVSVHDSEQLMLAKQFADADPVDDFEEEEASSSMSSQCMLALGRSAMQREKALARAKDAKYWRKYQQTKHLKVLARDTLIAALADSALLGEIEEGADEIRKPQPLPRRNDKGNRHGAKARRKARFASAAARCYSFEDEDEMPPVQVVPSERTQVSKSVKTERAARSEGRSELQLRALKRERAAKTERQSEGSSADVKVPSASPEGESKKAKRQSGEGGSAKEEAKKKHSKQCIIA